MYSLGSWKLDPYLSFSISAFVELLACILVHAILDRIGRKIPYCFFSILFCLVAFAIVPVQNFMEKDGRGLFETRSLNLSMDDEHLTIYLQHKHWR